MPEAPPHSEIPVPIPDHELIRPIGRGSYGEVWLARNVLGEYRAVKILRRDAFDRDRPLERELEGIQKFEPISRTHEHQVHILQIGRFSEGFYYVMELADDASDSGEGMGPRLQSASGREQGKEAKADAATLSDDVRLATYIPKTLRREVQRRGRLPVPECVEVGLKLASALAHLHGHGLVHRDVKPSNIIFAGGEPKLADIGLVASSEASVSCVGTEGFLPPEGPGKPQADLYALGKVLYEISTGRDRHDFPELPTLLREDPAREALQEFNEIILCACDPNAQARYSTARAMAADLDLLRAGKSLQKRRRRERRLTLAGKSALAVAAAALIWGALSPWWREPRTEPGYAPVRLTVDDAMFWRIPAQPRQFDFSPNGERIVFSRVNLVSVYESGTGATRPLTLQGAGDWKPANGGTASLARWAPDNLRFALQMQRKMGSAPLAYAVFVVDADTGEMHQIGSEFAAADQMNDLCWLPDGRSLTCVVNGSRLVTLAVSGERRQWPDAKLPPNHQLRLGGYSQDGRWLLVSTQSRTDHRSSEVWAWPHLGERIQPLTKRIGFDGFPTWSPDDRAVYYISEDERVSGETWGISRIEIDPKTAVPRGKSTRVFAREGFKLLHPKFVAGGKMLSYAVMEPKADIWVSDSDRMEKGTVAARGKDPVLSPDGQTIYFVGERADQTGVFAIDRNGRKNTLRKITPLVPIGPVMGGLQLSPDGDLLAFFSGAGKERGLFQVSTATGQAELLGHSALSDKALPVWSPDGQWLAYTDGQQLIRISRSGQLRETLAELPWWEGWSLCWSSDGAYLAAFGSANSESNSDQSSLYIVGTADKAIRKLVHDGEGHEKEGLQWHPSSQYLTYMTYGVKPDGAEIRRAYLDGRPSETMIAQADHWDYVGVWAPDGRRFFFISSKVTPSQSRESEIHVYDVQTEVITHGIERVNALPRWSRDGRTAVWGIPESLHYFEVIDGFR